MSTYAVVKWIHIVSSTILFGMGIGSAFYLLCAALSRDAKVAAWAARWVVRVDATFTTTTVIVQPLTGWWLARIAHFPLDAPWLRASIVLYAVAIGCWLPVIGLQVRMRNLSAQAQDRDAPLPRAFLHALFAWCALGVPALVAFLAIFYLMVAKPAIG